MANRKESGGDAPSQSLNYFNYFTEVEEEFVRRRGKSLLISPMEWALVESWKNAGIPLHVVLRAINQAFDAYDARPTKHRRINSIFYCQQEVEATYAEYRMALVGAPPAEKSAGDEKSGETSKTETSPAAPPSPYSAEELREFIARLDEELQKAETYNAGIPALREAITRARRRLASISEQLTAAAPIDTEALERDLDAIDRLLVTAAEQQTDEAAMAALRREAETQLKSYRKKMDPAIYEQTVRNFITRRLRETHHLPRLSLLFI